MLSGSAGVLGLNVSNPERFKSGVEIGQVASGARDVLPTDCTVFVDSKSTADLPATPTLGGPVPDALIGAEAVDRAEGKQAQHVPGA